LTSERDVRLPEKGMRSRAVISVLVLLFAVTAAASGFHMALHALPFLALVALLVCGHFVGEERILARRARPAPHARRAPARRWTPARPGRSRSLFARSPRCFRGPPAAAL
jgi:hypothetical protein